jgi:hypothetical protein
MTRFLAVLSWRVACPRKGELHLFEAERPLRERKGVFFGDDQVKHLTH